MSNTKQAKKNFIRNSWGSPILEFALILPVLVMLALTLVGLSRLYYTHNLVKQTVSDTVYKASTLFRSEFFMNSSVNSHESFTNKVIQAIKNENSISRFDTSFLDEPEGITISFKDLGDPLLANQDNSFAGALTLYLEDISSITSYNPISDPGIPPEMILNCSSDLTQKPMYFKPYQMTITFKKDIEIGIFGIFQTYTINEHASHVLHGLHLSEMCDKLLA